MVRQNISSQVYGRRWVLMDFLQRHEQEERGFLMNIYVGNLPYQLEESELRSLFEQYGEVTSANIVRDKQTGKSKGFGFVETGSQADSDKAIKELNGSAFKGRNLKVNEARPRERSDNNMSRQRY
ncbi:MAG: RNA-binding protein [Pseudomonadota bacterium]